VRFLSAFLASTFMATFMVASRLVAVIARSRTLCVVWCSWAREKHKKKGEDLEGSQEDINNWRFVGSLWPLV
jgi:hypothetical protein